MIEYVWENWPVFVGLGVIFFIWKFGMIIIKARILHRGFGMLQYYGGGDLRIDRRPGWFGGGKRRT